MTLKRRREIYWRYRVATVPWRALPEIMVVGAQKAGTKSLHWYLRQHPEMMPAYKQEVNYFDGGLEPERDAYERPFRWYRAHFPLRRAGRKTYDVSPLYLSHPLAPGRIAEKLPRVKIIALLRDPVERTISHYFHQVGKGREPLGIREALDAEEARLGPALDHQRWQDRAFIHLAYKRRSLYYEQLRRYERYFDWEEMLVLSSEEFFADLPAQLSRVFEFIGVEPSFMPRDVEARNVGANKRPVEPGVRRELRTYFYDANQRLYGLLGRDLGW